MDEINGYKLLQVLGSGAYGVVRHATTRDANDYAVKCVSRSKYLRREGGFRQSCTGKVDPLQCVKQELAILRKVDHPNIVRMHDAIDDPGHDTVFMVLELIAKGPVMTLPPGGGSAIPFSEERARLYISQVVLAVEYLHAHDIVHRDIKPDNILLHRRNVVKLTNFGIAHACEDPEARVQQSVGTPAFLPPEVVSPDVLGPFQAKPMDIWALGITLHCFLYGCTPWRDSTTNVLQLYKRIREDTIRLEVEYVILRVTFSLCSLIHWL